MRLLTSVDFNSHQTFHHDLNKFKNFKLSPSAVKVGHFFKRRRSSELEEREEKEKRALSSILIEARIDVSTAKTAKEKELGKNGSAFFRQMATRRLAASLVREKVKDGR